MRGKNRDKKQHKSVTKMPSIGKSPRVFEQAFERRLGQHPTEYLAKKFDGGSDRGSVRNLFDIVSAEASKQNNCVCLGFEYYYPKVLDVIKEMKKRKISYI